MTVQTQTWALGGGLDLVSPALSIPAGAAILAQNFEPELSGGYRRMDGYAAFDGTTTGTPAAVPGSGDIRGIWIYGGDVYAFRDNAGGTACVMHKATISGWTVVTTPVLAAGGEYEFVNYNFTGHSGTIMMYGCDGANKAFQFDGTTFTQLTTGMTTDTPNHIAAFKNHLFLSFTGGSVQHSGLGDPTTWTLSTGAGELATGMEVTGLHPVAGNALVIFSRVRTHILYGTSSADWDLKIFSEEAGAKEKTIAFLENDLYFLNDAGVTTLQAVQAYGDFATSNLSQTIKPFLDSRKSNVVAAIVSQEKNQYRVFFDDKTVLVGSFVNREVVGFTTFLLDHQATTAVNGCGFCGSVDGDLMYFGTDEGYIMHIDSGTSFNGGSIQSFLRLPFTHLQSPHRKKRFRKIVVDVDAGSQADISYSVDFEYGERGSSEQTEIIYGSGSFWDVGEWDSFTWSSPAISRIEGYIDGSGRNFSLLISHNSTTDPAFTLQGVQLNYSLRGLVR
ncbi:MAG TPA: hypothetical protein HPP79_11555 [Gammaproteobacteria bacterium]|mgnify:FL=1|jgi:hypothetical protein|nr:hypothetical protein [Gammaproteobacteria bacterium]